jgi:hypothetical protein
MTPNTCHLPDALLDTLQDETEAHFDPTEIDA